MGFCITILRIPRYLSLCKEHAKRLLTRTMSSVSSNEVDLQSELVRSFLNLDRLDPNIFRAPKENLWHPLRSRFIFGGQVVGQALVAASNTVSRDHHAHSIHCYFLRGGNSNWPILYHVDRTRDGETYTTRSVKATQDGKAIFTMQSSFKLDEEQIYQYQMEMPRVPGPESFLDVNEILRLHLGDEDLPDHEKDFINRTLTEKVYVHVRPLDPAVYLRRKPGDLTRLLWMKVDGEIGDDIKLHQCVAAYMSDISLLGTALQPGGPNYEITFMTSLDHSIWFHNPFQANEWMLYESFSPQGGKGRAFCYGRLWRQDGVLAMSTAQEGVVRNRPVQSNL